MITVVVITYFMVLMIVSRMVTKNGSNADFFVGNRRSPWYLVAFGMIGASISGVTFVSVPGMVLKSNMMYLQTCIGFIFGYLVVAFVLLPIYYRQNISSIYTVLKPLGSKAHKTGSLFFILSKLLGSAAKFFVPCFVISESLGMPMPVTIVLLMTLIWLYTRRGGIRTLVWTDVLQTTCMLVALVVIIYNVVDKLGMSVGEAVTAVAADSRSSIFEFADWSSPNYFFKSFISGIFIVIVMTGLDQDMMQKNLTCKTLRHAQKDMCSYGLAFVPVNMLFLALGILLAMLYAKMGMALPERSDEILTSFISNGTLGTVAMVCFSIGIVAASFSTIDGSLTALTTCFCVDIMEKPENERMRRVVHVVMAVLLMLFVMLYYIVGVTSLIDMIYTLVSYTYGPLLGLFLYRAYTSVMKKQTAAFGWLQVGACIISPLVCYVMSVVVPEYTGYHFGYEMLLINGILTFSGVWLLKKSNK